MFVGINSYFEHPSIAIIEDSNLLYASEDERFTGLKGGKSYNPHHPYLPLTAGAIDELPSYDSFKSGPEEL